MNQQQQQQPQSDEGMVFGIRPVIELIKQGKEIDRLFIQQGLRGDSLGELMKLIKERQIYYKLVPAEKLNRLTRKNHQGVICFSTSIEFHKLDQVIPEIFEKGETPFILILDRITDVRNFGAIARSAECAGAQAIVTPAQGASPVNGDAMKTSAGALGRIRICREKNLKDVIYLLKESGVKVIGCTEKGNKAIFQADLTGPVAIIMGSEEDGISPAYLSLCDDRAYIPMSGKIASLNVSVAAGIATFEVVRQRKFNKNLS